MSDQDFSEVLTDSAREREIYAWDSRTKEMQQRITALESVVEQCEKALNDLENEMFCGCTNGSFIYACGRCRIKNQIIKPALAAIRKVKESK